MSDDQSAASVMEEIQKMRQDMIDLKTQVKTAEDRAEKAEEAARNAEAGQGRAVETVRTHTSHQARIPTPRFTKGMTLEKFRSHVSAWQKMKAAAKEQEGLLLYMELPVEDAYGGLQSHIDNMVGLDNLAKADGAERLLEALEKVIEKPEISKLRDWWRDITHIRQKPGWNMERYILEVSKLVKIGKEKHKVDLGSRVHASILTNGVTSIDQGMVAVLIKDIKLDGSGDKGEEANLHSDCEKALRNFVPGGNNAHNVNIARDVFGNEVRSGNRSSASSEDDPSDVLYGRGGGGKRKGGPMGKEDWDRHKKQCLREGKCFHCSSKDHMAASCPIQKKKMDDHKKAVLAKGKVWDNRDGTFEHPDGTIRNNKKIILRQVDKAGASQDQSDRQYYVHFGPPSARVRPYQPQPGPSRDNLVFER